MAELNVLVVDDEPAVRQVLAAAIAKAGYAVEAVGSAAEALARLDKTPFDVVLSDVWGVVHNGVQATPEACDALARFRQQGGTVVLITNG